MRFYLYADDFGLRTSKTSAIDEAFCKGWIQSAGMIVNTENYDEAASLAEEHGYKERICFHLNLTDRFPLTEAVCKTALCMSDGCFARLNNPRIQRYCMSVRAIHAIREECEAQMRRFREKGFTSSHIDSHRWIMFNLPVWFAIKPLLGKYGFKTTRSIHGHLLDTASRNRSRYYQFCSLLMRSSLEAVTDWSGCFSEYRDAIDCDAINDNTFAEVYVHPEIINGVSIDTYFSYHKGVKTMEDVVDLAFQIGFPEDVFISPGRH